jgi:hypothetical protein
MREGSPLRRHFTRCEKESAGRGTVEASDMDLAFTLFIVSDVCPRRSK